MYEKTHHNGSDFSLVAYIKCGIHITPKLQSHFLLDKGLAERRNIHKGPAKSDKISRVIRKNISKNKLYITTNCK